MIWKYFLDILCRGNSYCNWSNFNKSSNCLILYLHICLTSNLFHQGNLRPEDALQSLTIYEGNFGRLKDEREKCARAKEALELTDVGLLSGSEERVQVNSASTNQRPSYSKCLPGGTGLGEIESLSMNCPSHLLLYMLQKIMLEYKPDIFPYPNQTTISTKGKRVRGKKIKGGDTCIK